MNSKLESDSSIEEENTKLALDMEETWLLAKSITREVYWPNLALIKLVEKFCNGIGENTAARCSGPSSTLGGSGERTRAEEGE